MEQQTDLTHEQAFEVMTIVLDTVHGQIREVEMKTARPVSEQVSGALIKAETMVNRRVYDWAMQQRSQVKTEG